MSEFLSSDEIETGEKINPTIRLEIFRHGPKEPNKMPDRSDDNIVRLTPEGRIGAQESGKTKNPQPEVAISFGSPRERAQEEALRQMLANEKEIGPSDSLEDIREKVSEQVKIGRKDAVLDQLNFNTGSKPEVEEISMAHYRSKDLLVWTLNQSNEAAKQYNDSELSSYDKAAGNIAEIIAKYVSILPNWNKIAQDNPEKYEKYNNEMQRLFGTHQSYSECFLMKIIDKLEGRQAVERFLDSLPNKNGFGFSEGYSIVLELVGEKPQIKIVYKNQEWNLTPELLNEIIEERNNLLSEIQESA